MATSAHISLIEYMKTSYRPDREFVDGELSERNVGRWEHARLQAILAHCFGSREKSWSVKAAIGQRLRVSPTRVRIPDVMLVRRGPQPDVTVDPPILVVEILSPNDTYTDTQRRCVEYLNMGVRAVWIVDPTSRSGRQCVGDTWTAAEVLRVPGTPILVELSKLFAILDEE